MKRRQLPGQVADDAFRTVNARGDPVHATDVVFPIFKWSQETGHIPLGTGFFISRNGIFLTARHVLRDRLEELPTQPIIAVHMVGDTYHFRRVVRFAFSDRADIAVGVLAEMSHRQTGNTLTNPVLRLGMNLPPVGADIFTYAYPLTTRIDGPPERLDLHPGYYQGTIQRHYLEGRDRAMLPGPCSETTLHIHGGASGGPVFNRDGNVVAVNSTGYENDNVGFITPVSCALHLRISGLRRPNEIEAEFSVQELADLGYINLI